MVPRENKNNAYVKFGGTNKEYYGIFRNGLCEYNTQRILPCEQRPFDVPINIDEEEKYTTTKETFPWKLKIVHTFKMPFQFLLINL